MKNSEKSWNVFKFCLIMLFIFFLINYFIVDTGYYKKEITEKTILTNEKIQEFEDDVRNGNYIDIKNYTDTERVDDSSIIGDLGYNFSEVVNDFVTDKAIKIFAFLGKLFT